MRFILLIISLLFLVACGSDVNVKTTLNATQDVKEGDVVYFSQEIVGEITDVQQSNGKTTLSIGLSEKGAELVKQEAAVVVNRLKPNLPVEIYNKRDATELVQDGQELQGLSSMFQLGAWMVGDTLNIGDGEDSLLGYVNAFQRYLEGDKFQEDKKAIQDGVEQLGKEAEVMAETLNKEFEKASTDLAEVEEQAAQAVEQLSEELAPVMGELAKSGKAISDELEKFAKNIENQNQEGKELGSSVLTSLLLALEKVNEGIEKAQTEPQPFKPIPNSDIKSPEENQEKPTVDQSTKSESSQPSQGDSQPELQAEPPAPSIPAEETANAKETEAGVVLPTPNAELNDISGQNEMNTVVEKVDEAVSNENKGAIK